MHGNRTTAYVRLARGIWWGVFWTIGLTVGIGRSLPRETLAAEASPQVSTPTATGGNWDRKRFDSDAGQFLKTHCLSCHGPQKQKAKLSFENLGYNAADTKEIATWQRVLEQIEIGAMPPDDQKQPSAAERQRAVAWINEHLVRSGKEFELKTKLLLPEFGNRVNHEALFDGTIKEMPYSPSRLWRISPYIFDGKGLQPGKGAKMEPLNFSTKTDGLRDYSSQEILGESGFSMLMMALDDLLSKQMHDVSTIHFEKGKSKEDAPKEVVETSRGNPLFKAISEASGEPSQEAMDKVIREEFHRAMGRAITPAEMERYLSFMKTCLQKGGNESGLKVTLMAIYLSPESLYRMELGLGEPDEYGRRFLSPRELAFAISYALTDSPPTSHPILMEALESNSLSTKADVERVVRRMITAGWPAIRVTVPGKFDRLRGQGKHGYAYFPRVVRFFEEFFDYPKSAGAFKDGKHGSFGPRALIAVAQGHIGAIVNEDSHVFENLLTSPRFNYNRDWILQRIEADYKEKLNSVPENQKEAVTHEYEEMKRAAANLPQETARAGFLTDPSWLIAHSKCTENDPVRRGKWIRERLLAGNVPDLPIGVDAKIPEDHTRTLRDRFSVVNKEECWKCHKTMNPLGMPFEGFNDVGRIRSAHYLHKKNGEFLETIDSDEAERLLKKGEIEVIPLDASGELTGTGDPTLDGPVRDAKDLVERLAKSTRVRQSIIRHAFRYWMGRNEMLSDSQTLIAADQAYVKSDGKFSEVILSLLTSDSFLYRK